MSEGVIVVGGEGYLGARLCPLLRSIGFEVESVDAGVYGNVPPAYAKDVREMEPPADGRPVVWLAAVHREPEGLATDEDRGKWCAALEDITFTQPEKWVRAGHPLLFPSSMQVIELMGASAYGYAKRMFESRWTGQRGVQIVRFGTVWGGFNSAGPVRVETAINSALLGRTLTDNYLAYTTHIDRALTALAHMLMRPFLGTVENVTDEDAPISGPEINAVIDTAARERTTWQILFMLERAQAEKRSDLRKPREHFTRSLARFYHLPWPEGTKEEWKP